MPSQRLPLLKVITDRSDGSQLNRALLRMSTVRENKVGPCLGSPRNTASRIISGRVAYENVRLHNGMRRQPWV
jgi:hypothetical protein